MIDHSRVNSIAITQSICYVHDEESVELRLRSDSEWGGLPVDGRGLLAIDSGLSGGSHSGLDVKPGGSGGGLGLTK